MRLFTLFCGELARMARQRGTYAGPIMLAIFIGLFVWGMWAAGPPTQSIGRQLGDDFVMGGNLITGPAVPYYLLEVPVAIDIFIPLLIGMIAGGIVAGEAQRGTLRTMLTRPVRRWVVVVAKVGAAFIHATSLVLFLGGFSLLLGYLVFGRGDIITFRDGLRVFLEPQALLRLALAYGVVVLSMWSVAAIAVLCSTIFEHPLTASGVTVGFLIVSVALMVMPYFEWLSPYLLTSHLHGFKEVFKATVDWRSLGVDLWYVAEYAVIAVAITLLVFCRKDMTC